MFTFCSLCTNRTVVQKRTLKKYRKQKSKKKTMTPMCRVKQTPMKMATRKPWLEKLPPQKQKTFLSFCDGFAKSSLHDEKWIQRTECLLWAHVECLDAKIHMYICEYCKYQVYKKVLPVFLQFFFMYKNQIRQILINTGTIDFYYALPTLRQLMDPTSKKGMVCWRDIIVDYFSHFNFILKLLLC